MNDMRLIDADELMKLLRRMPLFERLERDKGMFYVERSCIDAMPTIDAVHVVRCKDCQMQWGCKIAQYLGDNGFCSYGERK